MSTDLKAGSYIVALSEFFNVPIGPNLSDGFLMQGQGNFTGSTCGTRAPFMRQMWLRASSGPETFRSRLSSVPEPATVGLMAIPFLLFGAARMRKSVLGR